ncbi:MAG: hypothetical protein M3072_09810 [Candidatus Dormibacteraeota bacterium]|nr:hypothetical protein [Candidatus Dormibacteraeota bacterium]
MIGRSEDRGVIAKAVALGVAGVPGVARLSPGGAVEAATYFAGGKLAGVVIREDQVVIHIVVNELPIARVSEHVREVAQQALRALGAARPVEVVVEDLEVEQLPRILGSTALSPSKVRMARVR